MRVFLLGFMGCGKSTVGAALAQVMEMDFIDLDRAVEEVAGTSVQEIFARDGELFFRSLETGVLMEAVIAENVVVATGGGTPLHEGNMDLMLSNGLTIWLNEPVAASRARLSADECDARPLLGDRVNDIKLYNRRKPAYQRAEVQMELGGCETPIEIAEKIAQKLRSSP